MASQGKKGKKPKGKTINLNDFLSDGKPAQDGEFTTVVAPPKSSWADEMDDYDDSYNPHRNAGATKIVLPNAPRAARGPDIDEDRIPREPPFSAYIANLPYDIDDEDLTAFFSKLNLKEVRLPRDGDPETGRLKGFGYADFNDRASLIEALTMSDQTIKNRKVRVDLASGGANRDQRGSGGRMGGGGFGGRDEETDNTPDCWRSAPRDSAPPTRDSYERREPREGGRERREGGFGGGAYESPRDRLGVKEDRDDRRGGDRGSGFETDFDRSQMRSASDRPPPREDHGGGGFDRDRRGGGGGGGFDRFDRNDRDRRDDRGGRDGGGFDNFTRRDRDDRRDDNPRDGGRDDRDGPKERPRLQLAKRSDKKEEGGGSEEGSKGSSSIFGGAKPVDTTRKEQEIAEKLGKKKEEAEKAVEKDSKPAKKVDIFGAAKPVDTTAREREIEERLRKKEEASAAEKGSKDESEGEKRPAGRRVINLDRRDGDRRDGDRRDGDRRDGDRRDGDRRDDRRDNHRDGDRKDDRRDNHKDDRRRDRTPPPMKKLEEKPVDIVSSNKFEFLENEEEGTAAAASGNESE